MLLLLPVVSLTACVYRYLQLYAPSNRLIARVRASRPRCRLAAAMLLLALLLTLVSGTFAKAVADGAPSGLQLLGSVAAWDAIKLGTLSIQTAARALFPRFNTQPLS